MSSRPKSIPDPPATSRFLIIASVFLCVVTLSWLGSHWARPHGGKPSDAHSHTPASGAYQPTYQPLPNGALTSLVPSRSRHLDRDWEQVVSVINRENPDGATGWNPPATDPEIVDAESLAGIKFPHELRWLLKRQNGQTADSGATFYNGTRLMSASEIADAYVMQQGIMDHIAPDRDRNIRPSLTPSPLGGLGSCPSPQMVEAIVCSSTSAHPTFTLISKDPFPHRTRARSALKTHSRSLFG